MTREQIEARMKTARERLWTAISSWSHEDAADSVGAGNAPWKARLTKAVDTAIDDIIAAAELQAPPTGEEVEKAWANWERRAVAWGSECGEGTPDAAYEAERKMDEAVRAYGAACRDAGRAEAMAEKAEV